MTPSSHAPLPFGEDLLRQALGLDAQSELPEEITSLTTLPGRAARTTAWPQWVPGDLREHLIGEGIEEPYIHQVELAELLRDGQDAVIATATASGKSLGYQLAALAHLAEHPQACVLYISPTKALGNDQLRSTAGLAAHTTGVGADTVAAYDGDTPQEIRGLIRDHCRWIGTNPDMVHAAIARNHLRFHRVLRNLAYIIIDECHIYRGVFGAHVALTLRRLLRIARSYGANPVVCFASATTAHPELTASRLSGRPTAAVTEDGSPQGQRTIALWQPGFVTTSTTDGPVMVPLRRPVSTDSARLLANLIIEGSHALVFVRSRRGAEAVALSTQDHLRTQGHGALASTIAAYRAGYLATDRRQLERDLATGTLRGVATTNALELGVDIGGLDAVITAGFPGTVASFWQQAGRAGRRGQGALVMFMSRADPMDTYLVTHPEVFLHRPVEAAVFDPTNPYILAQHLRAAAAERPLTAADIALFEAEPILPALVEQGFLRLRGEKYFPAASDAHPHDEIHLRGGSGEEIVILDHTTGQIIGTIEPVRALSHTHTGAVYVHQGASFVVDELDLDNSVALVHAEDPPFSTQAREDSTIRLTGIRETLAGTPDWLTVQLVDVTVTAQVLDFQRRLPSGEILATIPLESPPQHLDTVACLYTIDPEQLRRAGVSEADHPGALHAAEHAAIGLLPLIATCDRWDIGGVSTALHEDTGLPSVFVYDGYQGGAGFAERGFHRIGQWLTATADTIEHCRCQDGCPSCVQSPKCGNGNNPLDKAGALTVLRLILQGLGTQG